MATPKEKPTTEKPDITPVPKNIVMFKRNIGDTIKIKSLNIEARISEILMNINGVQYKIIYWYDGCRNETCVYDWEID